MTYEAALKILNEYQEPDAMVALLERIVAWERANPQEDRYHGFEWHEVHGDARTLNTLVTKQILNVVLKTNKSTSYRAVDVDALERAVEDFEQEIVKEPEEPFTIPPDLFSIIVGHEDKKEIIARSLNSEKPVHCLLWGSVASAKTLILEELSRLPNSKFVLGSSLTKAGLYEVLFNEKPRILILDELDKVDDADNLTCLLSLMERGLIAETKWRRHRSISLKTWVFASANYIDRLPTEVKSRFTTLRFGDYTSDEYVEVAVKVLHEREGLSLDLAEYIAKQVMRVMMSRDVRDSVKVARLLTKKTPEEEEEEEADHIIKILAKQR